MMRTRTLGILIFEEVEVLDFCGPFEVFSVACRFTDPPAFNILTVAEKSGPILTRGGLSVNPHHRLADCPSPDLFLVPGGQGTRKEMHNPALIAWIKKASPNAELILSVCTRALLLAKVGLLDGLEATTHHSAIDLLRQIAPNTTIHDDRRFADNGADRLLGGDRCGNRHEPAHCRKAAGQGNCREDGQSHGVSSGRWKGRDGSFGREPISSAGAMPSFSEECAMNLSPVEATNRINESVTVEMVVQRTKCCTGSKQVFLDSEPNHRDHKNLGVVVTESGRAKFGEAGIAAPTREARSKERSSTN